MAGPRALAQNRQRCRSYPGPSPGPRFALLARPFSVELGEPKSKRSKLKAKAWALLSALIDLCRN